MRYATDLTDPEWQLLQPFFPKPGQTGRPREHTRRELLNAMFYLVRTSCQWRNLPTDFAPWGTVHHYFRQWKRSGLWETMHTRLRQQVRVAADRQSQPSAAIVDSQNVKSSECSDARGDDAGQKINGRKRHLLVDTLGLVLLVMVLPANLQDRDAARQLLDKHFGRCTRRRVKHSTSGPTAATPAPWWRGVARWRLSHAPNGTASRSVILDDEGAHLFIVVGPRPNPGNGARTSSSAERFDG